MANVNLTTSELSLLSKPFLPRMIQQLQGTKDGFSFSVDYNHGIPFISKSIPLALRFIKFLDGIIYMNFNINQEVSIMKLIPKSLIEKIFYFLVPEKLRVGIAFDGEEIQIRTNELITHHKLQLEVTTFDINSFVINTITRTNG
jgi:hypothetical protein